MKIIKLLVCLAAVWMATNLRAQEITASIRGMVTDPCGAVVEGPSVTAGQIETGLRHSTTTDHASGAARPEIPVPISQNGNVAHSLPRLWF